MSEDNVDWKKVLENTSIIRFPKQKLATFGNTSINYYVITEPLYTVIDSKSEEGVVRTGVVVAEKPAIITPYYAMHLQGFSEDAYEYFKEICKSFSNARKKLKFLITPRASKRRSLLYGR